MKLSFFLIAAFGLAAVIRSNAAPLSEAQVTEMKNQVNYRAESEADRAARLGDRVRGADVLRTGEKSLAEMEFEDKTITRLGPQSVFSFKSAEREFQVKEGLGLFCMPKGSGGGRIVTAAITAAIEGTTVLALAAGKIVFLEGTGKVFTNDGRQQHAIRGGEIAFLEKGQLVVRPIALQPILRSRFLRSRPRQLPTTPLILAVAREQENGGVGDINDPAGRNESLIVPLLNREFSGNRPPLLP